MLKSVLNLAPNDVQNQPINKSKESRPGGQGFDIIAEGDLYHSIPSGKMGRCLQTPYHPAFGEGISCAGLASLNLYSFSKVLGLPDNKG